GRVGTVRAGAGHDVLGHLCGRPRLVGGHTGGGGEARPHMGGSSGAWTAPPGGDVGSVRCGL
ncbi:hypothetical protein MNEG_15486, partial [Monoraphidium neglectum]